MKSLRLALLPVFVAVLVSTPGAATAAAPETRPVYAHRGGTSVLVENTRENYLRAAVNGSRLWETDVRFSSTNYPVLLHDADLRKFGCPTISISTVSVPAARKCTAANGQSISTLYEFVTDLSAQGAGAFIELKTVPTAAQWTILETRISALKDRLVIESFRPAVIIEAGRRGYDTAFLSKTAVTVSALPSGTDWYAPDWTTLTAGQVTTMHAAGIQVVGWTPSCAQWPSVPSGVDALISNDLVQDC